MNKNNKNPLNMHHITIKRNIPLIPVKNKRKYKLIFKTII